MKKTYKIEVDCANCAAKVERAIKKVDGVVECTINFMTQKMVLEIADEQFDDVFKAVKKAAKKAEDDFEIFE